MIKLGQMHADFPNDPSRVCREPGRSGLRCIYTSMIHSGLCYGRAGSDVPASGGYARPIVIADALQRMQLDQLVGPVSGCDVILLPIMNFRGPGIPAT
jgi:hypothetical protein